LGSDMDAAGQQQDDRWAKRSLIFGSILAGAFLLIALAGSGILLKWHVDFLLILSLLSAFALIDQALKYLPLRGIRLVSGLSLSAIAVYVLFWH
jgi:hypothetical protein